MDLKISMKVLSALEAERDYQIEVGEDAHKGDFEVVVDEILYFVEYKYQPTDYDHSRHSIECLDINAYWTTGNKEGEEIKIDEQSKLKTLSDLSVEWID